MKMKKKITTFGMLLGTLGSVGTSLATAPVAFADNNEDIALDVNSEEGFINTIGPEAQKIAEDYNIYASVMIAQAIIESGWGRSGLASAPNYNLFGIKGAYNGQSVAFDTKEYTGGANEHSVNANFRKYPSYKESLIDNAELIRKDIYAGAWKENAPTYKEATDHLEGIYATSETYADTLNKTIEKYDLTRFDVPFEGEREAPKNKVEPDFKLKQIEEVTPVDYEVKENDTLWGIARENKVSIDQINRWNKKETGSKMSELKDGAKIKIGENKNKKEVAYQEITETKDKTYKVVKGDSYEKIVEEFNITLDEFFEFNPNLSYDQYIYPNDIVIVGKETTKKEKILTDEEREALVKEAELKARELDRQDMLNKANSDSGSSTNDTSTETPTTTAPTNGSVHVSSNATEDAKKVIAVAEQQIGKPYVWGHRGPDSFDCSGLTQYSYQQALGIEIGSWTVPQESSGKTISLGEAKPGDLLFWGGHGATSHVAIYLGDGAYIHAPKPGDNVQVGYFKYWAPDFAVSVIN